MIVVCGEALFDMFAKPGSDVPVQFEAHMGGSPLNVAIGLARLGVETAFFGGISTDRLGELLMAKLAEEGVKTNHVHRSGYLTTLSVVQRKPDGNPAYTFYGENAADRMVGEDALPQFDTPPTILHLGSYSALVEPAASTSKTLITRERDNTLVSFDPNIRPTVVADMALWRKNTETLAGMADLLKVSDEDLALIYPGADPRDMARSFLDKGCKLVVLTLGGDGVEAFTRNGSVAVPGVKVDVIDTVGAGDTLQAALLMGLAETGATTREALAGLPLNKVTSLCEFAVKAAAVTCSRRGADLPRRSDFHAELEKLSAGG